MILPKKFGYFKNGKLGQYGVYNGPYNLLTTNHHYQDENDKKLPKEEAFHIAAKSAIEYARNH